MLNAAACLHIPKHNQLGTMLDLINSKTSCFCSMFVSSQPATYLPNTVFGEDDTFSFSKGKSRVTFNRQLI